MDRLLFTTIGFSNHSLDQILEVIFGCRCSAVKTISCPSVRRWFSAATRMQITWCPRHARGTASFLLYHSPHRHPSRSTSEAVLSMQKTLPASLDVTDIYGPGSSYIGIS